MTEKLKSLREPAAFVLLAAVGIQIIIGGVLVPVGASRLPSVATGAVGLSAGNVVQSYLLGSPLVIAAALVVAACVFWVERSARARLLVLLAVIVFAVLTVESLVFVVLAQAAPTFGILELVEMVIMLLVPAAAAGLMLVIFTG